MLKDDSKVSVLDIAAALILFLIIVLGAIKSVNSGKLFSSSIETSVNAQESGRLALALIAQELNSVVVDGHCENQGESQQKHDSYRYSSTVNGVVTPNVNDSVNGINSVDVNNFANSASHMSTLLTLESGDQDRLVFRDVAARCKTKAIFSEPQLELASVQNSPRFDDRDWSVSPDNNQNFVSVSEAIPDLEIKHVETLHSALSSSYRDKTYFIDEGANGHYALMLGENGTQIELIPNVSELNVLYGEDSDGDGSVNAFKNPGHITDMGKVLSVKVQITVDSHNDHDLLGGVIPAKSTFSMTADLPTYEL
ncbi:PilW family protein [Marinibactrum halimedae]|uniref:Uncharacterized protein n=1 Tax=Marinibactrum halimedae TaxID=1444977 RepID=A0AA37WP17_9GAMM|nr:PilW family protein [Marinibactrum halimedae]MCD9457617.1 PilW family protein [Marinibactrum halimedae]GLS28038.1 hypothetical protein GCM10007877_37570 [Marinibactrum halimedae]